MPVLARLARYSHHNDDDCLLSLFSLSLNHRERLLAFARSAGSSRWLGRYHEDDDCLLSRFPPSMKSRDDYPSWPILPSSDHVLLPRLLLKWFIKVFGVLKSLASVLGALKDGGCLRSSMLEAPWSGCMYMIGALQAGITFGDSKRKSGIRTT